MKKNLLMLLIFFTISSAYAADSKNTIKDAFSSDASKTGPLSINSNNLSLDTAKRVFSYSGNVKLTRGDITITSDRLIGEYGADNQIHTVTCDDNVVITKGTGMQAKSEHAVYNVKKEIIELTEAPELLKDGSLLSADKIRVFVNQDKSEAEGNVRVKVIQQDEINLKKK